MRGIESDCPWAVDLEYRTLRFLQSRLKVTLGRLPSAPSPDLSGSPVSAACAQIFCEERMVLQFYADLTTRALDQLDALTRIACRRCEASRPSIVSEEIGGD